jgi:hypothetical protein
MIFLYIAVVVLTAACGVFFYLKNRRKKSVFPSGESIVEYTPLGVKLLSNCGTTAEYRAAIDESLTQLFRDAQVLGYFDKTQHTDYTIHVKCDCRPSPESGTPSWRIRADEYDGTVFDQNPAPGIGEVLAAEQVITFNDMVFPEFIICSSNDLEYVKNVARYGAEHIILAFNDRAEYERTRFHGTDISHPIIPIFTVVQVQG